MEETLKALGLTEGEIHVYLALLKLGTSFVNDIATSVKKSRPHVYEILKSLQVKDLVMRTIKSGNVCYTAAPPSKLMLMANEKVRTYQDIEKEIAINLPTLQSQYHTAYGSRMRVYEGEKDIQEIFNDVLKSRTEILALGSSEQLTKYLQENPKYITRRVERGIKARMLIAKTPFTLRLKEHETEQLRSIRFIPETPTLTYIYDDKVVMLMTENAIVTGVCLESKKIAATCRVFFEQLWQTAET